MRIMVTAWITWITPKWIQSKRYWKPLWEYIILMTRMIWKIDQKICVHQHERTLRHEKRDAALEGATWVTAEQASASNLKFWKLQQEVVPTMLRPQRNWIFHQLLWCCFMRWAHDVVFLWETSCTAEVGNPQTQDLSLGHHLSKLQWKSGESSWMASYVTKGTVSVLL